METFHIPEGHLPWLAEAVAKLAKAAEKLGTPAPSYEVVERYERRWHDEIYGEQRQAMVKVEVDHVTPVKDGYQFVATIDHHQNEDGTYTPPAPAPVLRRLSKFAFLRLLTPTEYSAMFGQQSDPMLAYGVAMFQAAPDPFNIDDPMVSQMLDYCVTVGALTPQRRTDLWLAMEATSS